MVRRVVEEEEWETTTATIRIDLLPLATSTLLGPTTTATLVVVPTSTIIRQVVLRHLEWLGLLQSPKTQLLYQHRDPSTLPQPFVEAIVVEVEVTEDPLVLLHPPLSKSMGSQT